MAEVKLRYCQPREQLRTEHLIEFRSFTRCAALVLVDEFLREHLLDLVEEGFKRGHVEQFEQHHFLC